MWGCEVACELVPVKLHEKKVWSYHMLRHWFKTYYIGIVKCELRAWETDKIPWKTLPVHFIFSSHPEVQTTVKDRDEIS